MKDHEKKERKLLVMSFDCLNYGMKKRENGENININEKIYIEKKYMHQP